MIKKRKDGETSGTPENKVKKGKSEETKKAAAPGNKTEKPETENKNAKGVDEENSAGVSEKSEKDGAKAEKNKSGGDTEKQPSETDVLKLYLKQTLENSKRLNDENESLKKQVEQLNSQISQCKEKFDGLVAEYDNYRRRTTSEKENLGTEAISKSVKALLPALDNLERAMPFADTNPDSFKKGVEMTLRQLSEAFQSLGVEEIEAQDAVFDPELHDAVMHVDDDSLGESVITDVFQKGYRIGDKVVRHSVVKVAN